MGAETELPRPGTIIGVRYQIEALLGQGGMGAVFSAINQATGRAVAIKWMLPGAARSQEAIARFLAEARATAKIEHPNVIQILDVGQDGACPFLVMERLRGESLADRLQKHGRLSVGEALNILIQSCRGVAEAHNEGIIHRDLKPDNIFLCQGKDGSPRPPKVLDFGISKLYEEGGGPSLTRTGIAMGTPQYMSPEQLNARQDADARLDVYAMGVVAYECLTGRTPYNADGLFELVQQIAAGNPTPIRVLAPDVPPDFEAAVMRAMHVHRDYRFPAMREFLQELERIQSRLGGSVPAPLPPTAPVHSPVPQTAAHTGPIGGSGGWNPQSGYNMTPPPSGPAMGMHSGYGAPVIAPAPSKKSGGGLVFALVGGAVVLLGLLAVGVVGAVAYFAGNSSGGSDTPPIAGNDDSILDNPIGNIVQPENPRAPHIDVTFAGECRPRWDARLMVTGGPDSINVMSSSMAGLTGSIMLTVPSEPGTINISTRQRMDAQTAINVMIGQQLWTNMAIDSSAVIQNRIEDPISGSITVARFDSDTAVMDVTFHNVTLQNLNTGTMCTLNGRLQTNGTTYGY